MASEPLDSFDTLPSDVVRRGVHRGPRPRGRGWIAFAWAALATGVLVGVGALGLTIVNNGLPGSSDSAAAGSVSSDPASVTPTPTVVPTVDPAISVTILNGTTTAGLATRAGGVATDAGWSVGAEANASASDVAVSTVYYTDATEEGAAKGLAETLGGLPVEVSTQFEAGTITAVLGSDYADPAG